MKAPPDQVALAPAGVLVRIHVPLVGSPVKSMLPVGTEHVGCVMGPIIGMVAGPVELLIVTGLESSDVQPEELVTVKVQVPGNTFVMVVLAPAPVDTVNPPGFCLIVQLPPGKPVS